MSQLSIKRSITALSKLELEIQLHFIQSWDQLSWDQLSRYHIMGVKCWVLKIWTVKNIEPFPEKYRIIPPVILPTKVDKMDTAYYIITSMASGTGVFAVVLLFQFTLPWRSLEGESTLCLIRESVLLKFGREIQTLNSCLVNFYESGAEYVAPHADNESIVVRGAPIASVSLGVTRYFEIIEKS